MTQIPHLFNPTRSHLEVMLQQETLRVLWRDVRNFWHCRQKLLCIWLIALLNVGDCLPPPNHYPSSDTAFTDQEFWCQHSRQMLVSLKYSIFVRWHSQITNQTQCQNMSDRKDSQSQTRVLRLILGCKIRKCLQSAKTDWTRASTCPPVVGWISACWFWLEQRFNLEAHPSTTKPPS